MGEDEEVAPTNRSVLSPPIGFAHRGARADAPENTLEAFGLALEVGATGLESDVWLTSDGVPVLDHDGVVRKGIRRARIRRLNRADLPPHIPALEDLYRQYGTDFELSLDIKDVAAVNSVIDLAGRAGAEGRLWLCHESVEVLKSWRPLSTHVHLVHSGQGVPNSGAERHGALLASSGVNVVNLRYRAWSAGTVALYHRFGLLAFGWDAQFDTTLDHLLDSGIDAVYSDHVQRMIDAIERSSRL